MICALSKKKKEKEDYELWRHLILGNYAPQKQALFL